MPTFIGPKDVSYFQTINKEVYNLFFIPIDVYKIIKTNYNTTYNENPNKTFKDPYSIPAYIPDLKPSENVMLKTGMDEYRELTVYFSVDLLKQRGVEFPDVGDQLVIQNDTYLITQTNPEQYGSNLQIPLSHIVSVKRIHYEVPAAGTTIKKDY